MIEAAHLDPGLHGVASFTAQRRAVSAARCHALLEFPFVHVFVAGRAGAVLEVERQDLVSPSTKTNLVAVGAGNRHMRPGQHKAGLLVLGDGVGRAMEILDRVALLAAVVIRRGGELFVVLVLMTIR